MVLNEGVIVEILCFGIGDFVFDGEVGEIVVMWLDVDYLLLCFVIGDMLVIFFVLGFCINCCIKGWMGCVDQVIKIKGMFVCFEQIVVIVCVVFGCQCLCFEVSCSGEQDCMYLLVEYFD